MSSNRLKVLLVSLLAVSAVSAVASASASAAPTWSKAGAEVAAGTKLKIVINSDTSRLWAPASSIPIMIICAKDKGTGEIENVASAGVGKAAVTYEECKLWTTVKNNATAKQIIQKEKTVCVVANIEVKATMKLAYVPGSLEKEGVAVLAPETPPNFAVIKVTGCTEEGEYKVEGSVVGMLKRMQLVARGVAPSEEAVMQDVLFETNNEVGKEKVEQRFPKYELGGVTTEDVLKLSGVAAAYEATEQVEMASNAAAPFGPEPFGVHK